MAKKDEQRRARKVATRQRIVNAAWTAFSTGDYHDTAVRDIAKAAGLSTGAIFSNFETKAELFEAAMGFPPPVDGPLTRAAPMLLEALLAQAEVRKIGLLNMTGEQIQRVDTLRESSITLATSPLDGEAWARHLSAIRRDEPHLATDGQPAAFVPSGAAGDQ